MVLKYRVSLPGLKGFARVYEVKPTTSLYSLHKQMRADMDFPQDQVVLFKAFDAAGNVAARYSVFQDFGLGTIDSVTVAECHKRGEDKFIYFYDTTNVKSVIVTFDGEGVEKPLAIYPLLVETTTVVMSLLFQAYNLKVLPLKLNVKKKFKQITKEKKL